MTANAAGPMESWAWPPDYDDAYRPEPGQRHWFPRRETMRADERDEAILRRLIGTKDGTESTNTYLVQHPKGGRRMRRRRAARAGNGQHGSQARRVGS